LGEGKQEMGEGKQEVGEGKEVVVVEQAGEKEEGRKIVRRKKIVWTESSELPLDDLIVLWNAGKSDKVEGWRLSALKQLDLNKKPWVGLYHQWKFAVQFGPVSQLPRINVWLNQADKMLKKKKAHYMKRNEMQKVALAKIAELRKANPPTLPPKSYFKTPRFLSGRMLSRPHPSNHLYCPILPDVFIPLGKMPKDRAAKLKQLYFAICQNGSYSNKQKVAFIKKMKHTFSKSKILKLRPWNLPPIEWPKPVINAADYEDINIPTTAEELDRWKRMWDTFTMEWQTWNEEYRDVVKYDDFEEEDKTDANKV